MECDVKVVRDWDAIQEEYIDYLRDESRTAAEKIDSICWPENEDDVLVALAEARERHIPVTVSAARTGITASSVALCGGMVMSLEKFSMLKELRCDAESDRWTLVMEPGALLCGIQEALDNHFRFYAPRWPEKSRAAVERVKAEGVRLFYPPDPTEMSAAIGGTVATNASGARTYKYGPTRGYVRRIRVALASGAVLDITRGVARAEDDGMVAIPREMIVRPGAVPEAIAVPSYAMPRTKNCAGYYATPHEDLIDVFIGSEGTLGVITEVEIDLCVRVKERLSVLAFFDSEKQALEFVRIVREAAKESVMDVEALEFFGRTALALLQERRVPGDQNIPEFPESNAAIYTELVFAETAMEDTYELLEQYLTCCGSSTDNAWAGMEDAEIQRMKLFRHAVPETVNQIIGQRKRDIPGLYKIATDLAVPDVQLTAMMDFYHGQLQGAGLEYVIFGHVGDNHLHVNMMPRSEEELVKAKEMYRSFAEKAVELGGTVAAEHGIGKLKKPFLVFMYGEEGIEQMRRLKRSLDPEGMLGKGTLFD
jgi:D-lactate dehydrogenase (cytochrome)